MTIRTYLSDGFVVNDTALLSGASIEADLDWIGAGIRKLGCVNTEASAIVHSSLIQVDSCATM